MFLMTFNYFYSAHFFVVTQLYQYKTTVRLKTRKKVKGKP